MLKLIKKGDKYWLFEDSEIGLFSPSKFTINLELNEIVIVYENGLKSKRYNVSDCEIYDLGELTPFTTSSGDLFMQKLEELNCPCFQKNENIFNISADWGSISGNLSDQTDLQTALDSKLDKVSTAGVERAYIINADGSQGTKATSEFGGKTNIKPFDMIKVNNGINGVVNYGSGAVSLSSATYVNTVGSLIKGIQFTNIVSTTSTIGSFCTFNYLIYNSITLPFQSFFTYFGIANTSLITDSRSFCGFLKLGYAINNINPSIASQIAIVNDSGDANLQIVYNKGGIPTKIDLGSDFPARYTIGQNLYKVGFEFKSATSCEVKITNLITGISRTELVTNITLQYNVANTFAMSLNSNTTAATPRLLFNHLISQDNYEF